MSFSLSGGVEVYGFIAPTEITDEYPVIDPLYGIDGFRNVDTLSDLDNIPNLRRRAGMVVGVSGGTQYYKLNPAPWSGVFSDWSLFQIGSGGGTFTGGTVTGPTNFTNGLSANTLTVNDVIITGDTYTTGGTYSNGTIDFYYNTGGSYQVTGLYTGQTSYVNSLTTGIGLSADTTTGDITIINTEPDQVVTISGGTGILTGGTYPNFIIENTLPDQTVVLNNGTNINVTGIYPNFTIDVTGLTDNNTFTTGFTYQDNTFTISDNSGNTFNTTIDVMTGLTINGILSATTYQNLPPSTDYYVTGGTYDYTGGTVTLNRNDGNNVSITGFNYNDIWTVELINALSVDVYSPYNLAISSTTNILGSPTITLYDDNLLYTLGNTITIGSKITIVASVTGVTNLNIIRV